MDIKEMLDSVSNGMDRAFDAAEKKIDKLQTENTALKKRTESAESDWQLAETENETLHKKLRILRNAKCPKCDFRFKIRKLS